ncbi:MAG: hypothetical protein MZV63_04140 [Marinilabiliales bacterium]|nr:hypothetical protein [Marinilabiliales bacterium]
MAWSFSAEGDSELVHYSAVHALQIDFQPSVQSSPGSIASSREAVRSFIATAMTSSIEADDESPAPPGISP